MDSQNDNNSNENPNELLQTFAEISKAYKGIRTLIVSAVLLGLTAFGIQFTFPINVTQLDVIDILEQQGSKYTRPDPWTGKNDRDTMAIYEEEQELRLANLRKNEHDHRVKIWRRIDALELQKNLNKEQLIEELHKLAIKTAILEDIHRTLIIEINKIEESLHSGKSRGAEQLRNLKEQVKELKIIIFRHHEN